MPKPNPPPDYTKNEHGILIGKGGVSEKGFHQVLPYLNCAKEYQLARVRGIRLAQAETKAGLAEGSMFHAGRAIWFGSNFQTGQNIWNQMVSEVESEAEKMNLPTTKEATRNALKYLQEYVEHWSGRPKPRVLAVEHKLGPVPMDADDPLFTYRTARVDDVSHYEEAGGALCIGEAKTTSLSASEVQKVYELHGQPLLQHYLYRASKVGAQKLGNALGSMLDVVQKGYGKKKSKFTRIFLPITEFSLQWFATDMRERLRASQQITWDSKADRNITACTRVAGGHLFPCEFRFLCQNGPNATGRYVIGEKGESLKAHVPSDGKKAMPWE